jgi:cell division protein FtsQ
MTDPDAGTDVLVEDPATVVDASVPAGAGARRRPRTRRQRRRIAAACAVGLVAVGWVGWASPATLVEHVVVEAPRGLSEDAIRLASGISAHDHVPAVDAERVRLAVMTAIPAVADVDVSRSLPHTIRLEVTARTPFAAVDAGKGYYVMDAEGVVYDKVASAKKLAVIKARTEVGREAARAVLLSLPEDLRSDVRRVTAKTRDDVVLLLRDGATVRWGSAEEAALKARVLAGLVAVKATTYDVSAPLLPTTSGGPESDAQGTAG